MPMAPNVSDGLICQMHRIRISWIIAQRSCAMATSISPCSFIPGKPCVPYSAPTERRFRPSLTRLNMAADGVSIVMNVGRLAYSVYKACQKAKDNRENLADLGTYVFAVYHSLHALRDDFIHDEGVLKHMKTVEATLKKTEVFIQSEQQGSHSNPKLKRKIRALFKAQTQAERISTLHQELQSRLHELNSFSMLTCRDGLNKLNDNLAAMQTALYGHQHELRDEMRQLFKKQAKEMKDAFRNQREADRDSKVAAVLQESVNGVNKLLLQNQHLRTIPRTPTPDGSSSSNEADGECRKTAWRQRGVHVIKRDHIELGELIGAGAYGEVYKATWKGKECAVKMLPTGSMDQRMHNRVIEEANLHNALREDSLVQMLGVSLSEDERTDPWIVMELMDIGLNEFLDTMYDDISPVTLLDIGLQVSSAIDRLHVYYNVLHRDLKTANVLLKCDQSCEFGWRAKLSDFGMSETRETVSMSIRTSPHKTVGMVGTPSTMAPEIMMADAYGRSADMYSFGIVLYEIVTGEVAWDGVRTVDAMRDAVLRDGRRPRFPSYNPWDGKVDDDIWKDVCTLISQCWAQDAKDRPSFSYVTEKLSKLLVRAKKKSCESANAALNTESEDDEPTAFGSQNDSVEQCSDATANEHAEVEEGTTGATDSDVGGDAHQAVEGDNREHVPKHILSIVQRLQDGTDGQKATAARRLRALARDDATSRRSIAEAGGIKPLVVLLRTGTDETKENAAGALWNLTIGNADVKASIASFGGIRALVDLLRSGTDAAKAYAAGAISNVAANNSRSYKLIARVGGIELLVDLLRNGSDIGKENAAVAIRNVAANTNNKVLIANAGGIEPLVQLLRRGSDRAKQYTAGALCSLAWNAKNQMLVADAGAIEPLIETLRRGSNSMKENAARALVNLSFVPANRDTVRACGGIKLFKKLRKHDNAELKRLATKALSKY